MGRVGVTHGKLFVPNKNLELSFSKTVKFSKSFHFSTHLNFINLTYSFSLDQCII